MRIRRVWLAIVVLATLTVPTFPQPKTPRKEDPWLLLNKITHKRTYRIETVDDRCFAGTITSVGPNRLAAKVVPHDPNDPVMRTFERSDVVHVGVGWTTRKQLYYSGRSSWADVGIVRIGSRECLRINMKSGERYDVKPPYTVSDNSIAATLSGKRLSIPKQDIARVYGVFEKPVTDILEYDLDELGPFIVFDPYFYEYTFHLERYIPVLLYDVEKPEDNSPTACDTELERLRRKQSPQLTPKTTATPTSASHPSRSTSG